MGRPRGKGEEGIFRVVAYNSEVLRDSGSEAAEKETKRGYVDWGRQHEHEVRTRLRWKKRKQVESVCMPLSRFMSPLENVSPGISPHFLSQKIDENEREKKMPSTAANAIRRPQMTTDNQRSR